jgi:hypothetical protein
MVYQFPILGLARKPTMLVKVLAKPVFKAVKAVAEIVPIQGLGIKDVEITHNKKIIRSG